MIGKAPTTPLGRRRAPLPSLLPLLLPLLLSAEGLFADAAAPARPTPQQQPRLRGPQVDVILAHYNEDLAWLRNYTRPNRRFLVYSKAEGPVKQATRYLPNVGRESHTYLHHIVTNYDKLAPWNVFTQARAPTWGYSSGDSSSGHLSDNVTFDDYLRPPPGNRDSFFVLSAACRIPEGLQATRLGIMVPSLRRPSSGLCPADGQAGWSSWWFDRKHPHHRGGHAMVDFYHSRVLERPTVDDAMPITLAFAQGARFAVSKRRIQLRPRSYYEALLQEVSHEKDPLEGYFMEAMWYDVFHPESRQLSKPLCDYPEIPSTSGALSLREMVQDTERRLQEEDLSTHPELVARMLGLGSGAYAPGAYAPGAYAVVDDEVVIATPPVTQPPYLGPVFATVSFDVTMVVDRAQEFVADPWAKLGTERGIAATLKVDESWVDVQLTYGGLPPADDETADETANETANENANETDETTTTTPSPGGGGGGGSRRLASSESGLVLVGAQITIPTGQPAGTVAGVLDSVGSIGAAQLGSAIMSEVNQLVVAAGGSGYSVVVLAVSAASVASLGTSTITSTLYNYSYNESFEPYSGSTDSEPLIDAGSIAVLCVIGAVVIFPVMTFIWFYFGLKCPVALLFKPHHQIKKMTSKDRIMSFDDAPPPPPPLQPQDAPKSQASFMVEPPQAPLANNYTQPQQLQEEAKQTSKAASLDEEDEMHKPPPRKVTFEADREAAAKRIQTWKRGYLARRRVEEERLKIEQEKADREAAAKRIQTWKRGYLARRRVEEERLKIEQEKAARKIQGLYRGHSTRSSLKDKTDEEKSDHVQLTFNDLCFETLDQGAFKAELKSGMAKTGVSREVLDQMIILLRAGSVIANIFAPTEKLAEVRAAPLAEVEVMGVSAKITKGAEPLVFPKASSSDLRMAADAGEAPDPAAMFEDSSSEEDLESGSWGESEDADASTPRSKLSEAPRPLPRKKEDVSSGDETSSVEAAVARPMVSKPASTRTSPKVRAWLNVPADVDDEVEEEWC